MYRGYDKVVPLNKRSINMNLDKIYKIRTRMVKSLTEPLIFSPTIPIYPFQLDR